MFWWWVVLGDSCPQCAVAAGLWELHWCQQSTDKNPNNGRGAQPLASQGPLNLPSHLDKLSAPGKGKLFRIIRGSIWLPSPPKSVCMLIFNGFLLLSGLSLVAALLHLAGEK